MYNIIYKNLFYKKINIFNYKKDYKIKYYLNSLKKFYLMNKNFLINIIFVKKKNLSNFVFNQKNHKILFNVIISDIVLNYYKDIKKNKENLFHSFYHVLENEHDNKKKYMNMIFYFYIFKKYYDI
ncbi:hypothetical protein ACWNYI_00075 [Candidatus Vidania fulgoroideorum]